MILLSLLRSGVKSWVLILVPALLFACRPSLHASEAAALSSIQPYTGIWDMPTARILPDWNLRIKYGENSPYRYYGGAIGMFDRFEVHGQYTEITTIEAFTEDGYGHYKDRAAGARLVFLKESPFLPQLALGAFDVTGTALFGARYLTASKIIGNLDITLGAGQGILAGEYVGGSSSSSVSQNDDSGHSFLFSSLSRKTKLFGGIEWHINPRLTASAEYTPFEYKTMRGFIDTGGIKVKDEGADLPVNLGFKYKLTEHLHGQLALTRGDTISFGLSGEFPLNPEGFFSWKKSPPYKPGERLQWKAYEADNHELSQIIAAEIGKTGLKDIAVSCSEHAIWIEARNTIHLSDSRALGRMATVANQILPLRIKTLYLNLACNDTVIQSLKTPRSTLNAYLKGNISRQGFLTFSELNLYADTHWQEFEKGTGLSPLFQKPEKRVSFKVEPKVRTFLNNKEGFFKHKGVLRARTNYKLWEKGRLYGDFEFTLFNQYDELSFDPLEENNSVSTDIVRYEANSDPRVTQLAFNQNLNLAANIQGRFSTGFFDSAYAGFGAEAFRYFYDGLWGIGLETQVVRKRDFEANFQLSDESSNYFSTGFLNLYAQLWPARGLDAGMKIGRFLAGDPGVKFQLRRSFNYFTLGAWLTVTDTSRFDSEKNRGSREKGVYISIPFSIFHKKDLPGHFNYTVSSFTRDSGQTVAQPVSLYPLNPWGTPAQTRQTLNQMRQF